MNLLEVDGAIKLATELADHVNIMSSELRSISDALIEYQQFLKDELVRLKNEQ